ncbi:MAG: hypothetical protein Q8O87_00480 [bacterium]|nr:hypothetical protein [bacterium]
MTNWDLKKTFLISLIASLSIGALIAIFIFLFTDGFGEAEIKILLTTLAIGFFSLTGLCSSALYERQKYKVVSVAGVITSLASFVITTGIIWEIIQWWNIDEFPTKSWMILIVLSISLAHSSLLLLVQSEQKAVRISLIATLIFIALTATTLILMILYRFGDIDIFYYRLLGVFAVLDVLGTIVTPILKKVYSVNQPQ